MNEDKPAKTCPNCGAQLPEEMSFCPHCARDISKRNEVSPPRYGPGWALYSALIALAALLLAAGLWFQSRPQIYDNGTAEVLYTGGGVTYQVLAGWMDNRFDPAQEITQPVNPEDDTLYTFPQCLYINHPDSGVNTMDEFMENVERVTASFIETEHEEEPWYCDEPVPRPDYVPEAARVASIHFYAGSGQGRIQWRVEMKNGDVIHLYQTMQTHPVPVYHFTPEDTPPDTVEEVQALLDSLEELTAGDSFAAVDIRLPPVTYDGGITIPFAVNLYGAEAGAEGRTTFTGPIRVSYPGDAISYLYDVDIVGGGDGVGVSSSNRMFLFGCRIDHWRTGLLIQNDWGNAWDCTFTDNQIGIHFNADSGTPMDSRYKGDMFRNNGTAVLFERVPNRVHLAFPETVFSGNGMDIDNRCGQPLELEETIFEENHP